jgi:hypothetical protein
MEMPGQNVSFKMPAIADVDAAGYSAKYFDDAADALGSLIKVSAEIKRDPELSDIGKTKRLEPKQAAVVETVANRWDAIDQQELQLAAREHALYAVPQIDPMHSAMAIEDREIRDYLRSIGDASALAYLMEPENERLRLAVLRSPLPFGDELKKRTLEAWKEGKRQANPAEAAAIDSERVGIEWARRGLAQVAGISRTYFGKEWTADKMVKQIITSGNEFTKRGYAAFGFGRLDVARVQRQLDFAAGARQA